MKPKSWTDFELICQSAFNLRWGTTDLRAHGRPFQQQHGVDIFGRVNGELRAVQCKNTMGRISQQLVLSEIDKAKTFDPNLKLLVIATSADTDAPLQAWARNLDPAANGGFQVDVLFWQSIEFDLQRDVDTVRRHYPQFFAPLAPDPKRANDASELTRLLECLDLANLDAMLALAPKYIAFAFLDMVDAARKLVSSSSFHLSDAALAVQVHQWLTVAVALTELVGSAPYRPSHNSLAISFPMPMDIVRSSDREVWEKLEASVLPVLQQNRAFVTYIRQQWPEVDLNASSAAARQKYTPVPFFG